MAGQSQPCHNRSVAVATSWRWHEVVRAPRRPLECALRHAPWPAWVKEAVHDGARGTRGGAPRGAEATGGLPVPSRVHGGEAKAKGADGTGLMGQGGKWVGLLGHPAAWPPPQAASTPRPTESAPPPPSPSPTSPSPPSPPPPAPPPLWRQLAAAVMRRRRRGRRGRVVVAGGRFAHTPPLEGAPDWERSEGDRGAERALSLGRERSASTSFRETKGWNKVESGAQRSGVRRGVRACRWA